MSGDGGGRGACSSVARCGVGSGGKVNCDGWCLYVSVGWSERGGEVKLTGIAIINLFYITHGTW